MTPSTFQSAHDVTALLAALPKAELHVHIEGTLEPELMFALAKRNAVALPYASVEAVRAAYAFDNLQSFLDIYYAGTQVLLTEQDFFDMTWAYLERARADNVVHTEIFFDPQSHTSRGVAMGVVIDGIAKACAQAKAQWGTSSALILCFLRHLSEDDAIATLQAAKPYVGQLVGVGLDSSEQGHPPSKFARVFALANSMGLKLVAHAGEEGPPDYVWQALDLLGVQRIDHGVRSMEDPDLVARLAKERMPLTVCPLSNKALQVTPHLTDHPIKAMLDAGLCAMVNSDDPAYFGGYLNDNLAAIVTALALAPADLLTLVRNSFEASFITPTARSQHLQAIEVAMAEWEARYV
ncbi:adenosine deaminase [Comamonadaceae bacterium M7527]|nr:adenosine deaminase [Comamonadaceae bacterium M7527]